ncbi:hypothetical protein OC846_003962 [Tilletia horrida]|uniref:GTP 3',8-cyclase n=1 Tax=Tilletia horrida TaxID=155126 RepID=A0AAN6GP18_9BASI|nr:hypothetical protein OC845_004013 [Tilletia horrida]KAK0549657.1 hypothetical protein OC846_003962 [Tilletia horrida]
MRPPSCLGRRLAALDAVGPGRTSGGSTSSWRPPLCAQVHCAASSSRAAPASTRSTDGLQQLRQGSRRWQSSSVIQNQQLPPQQAQREHPISPPPTSFPAAQSSTSAKAVPSSQYLKDRHHRTHSYLRISLTEKCNLRCLYCMPEEGVPLTPSDKLLSQSELARLARLFVQCGVSKVRLTGGEPTLRRDLPEIMESLNELRLLGLRQIGMTSNGIALHRKLPNLVRSGLTHLNLSLDTLDPFKFELMTRRPAGLDAVLRSLDTALELGLDSVKINVVVLKGVNDNEDVLDFVAFTRDKPVTVRFIEYMPFDGNKWAEGKLVPYRTLLEKIQHRFGPLERLRDDDNDTSKGWRVPGFAGSIGFITSMTEHFCGTCNRLRITADGNLKVCLFGNAEVSLRDAMRGVVPASTSSQTQVTRSPATDAQLLDVISAAVQRKHARHAGMSSLDALAKSLNRPMVAIGG